MTCLVLYSARRTESSGSMIIYMEYMAFLRLDSIQLLDSIELVKLFDSCVCLYEIVLVFGILNKTLR